MTPVARGLAASLALGIFAACATHEGASPAGALPSPALRAASPKVVTYKVTFVIHNDQREKKLHVWNTYGGECTANQLPRKDLEPGTAWIGQLEIDATCSKDVAKQLMIYWYGDTTATGNYLELEYESSTKHSGIWAVFKRNGGGGFTDAGSREPVRTRCQTNSGGLIVCSAG